MSKTMSFDGASTVVVVNVNQPSPNHKGGGSVTIQPANVDSKSPVEATEKKNRIGELVTHTPDDILATIAPPPDADSYKGGDTATPANGLAVPSCATEAPTPKNLQGHASPLALQVGFFGDIPRWQPGSIIKYATYAGGYPSAADANYASQQLAVAANEWNRREIGVTFKWVRRLEDACFVLGYGGDQGGVLAQAFFPNGNDLNNVIVYKGAFGSAWKPYMWGVFAHELGHVLGLRHEFAMDLNPDGGVKEGGSVQFGPRDEFSVMNYRQEPPKITQLDADGAKDFYSYTGTSISGMEIKDWIPS